MKRLLLLFITLLSVVSVDASKSNGYDNRVFNQESVTPPDFSGVYVMQFSSTLTIDMVHYIDIFYMNYFYSKDKYVNVTIEKDSLVDNQYIVKSFGENRAYNLTATYNAETGNLEIPRQPFLPRLDHLHPPCELVNVDNHNAPITLSFSNDKIVVNNEWAALYQEELNGQYYYIGNNTDLMIPNAVMEWDNEININSPIIHRKEYVRVEQENNSAELSILNFCNRGKKIFVNLLNDTTFIIPVQLVYHFEDWHYWDDEWLELNSCYCYLGSTWDENYNEVPITGGWNESQMISNSNWHYGNASLSFGTEYPFTLTMLSGKIISPFTSDIPGDVNGDGEVTAADVTALYDVLLNNDSSHIVNGDQNGDGNITAADVTAVYDVLLNN